MKTSHTDQGDRFPVGGDGGSALVEGEVLRGEGRAVGGREGVVVLVARRVRLRGTGDARLVRRQAGLLVVFLRQREIGVNFPPQSRI